MFAREVFSSPVHVWVFLFGFVALGCVVYNNLDSWAEPEILRYWAEYCYKLSKKTPNKQKKGSSKGETFVIPVYQSHGLFGMLWVLGVYVLQDPDFCKAEHSNWRLSCYKRSQVGHPKSLATSANFSPAQNSFGWSFFKVDNDIAKT